MENIKTVGTKKLSASEAYEKAVSDIKWAEAAGRSTSTLNRLYKIMFAAEDALKSDPWMKVMF